MHPFIRPNNPERITFPKVKCPKAVTFPRAGAWWGKKISTQKYIEQTDARTDRTKYNVLNAVIVRGVLGKEFSQSLFRNIRATCAVKHNVSERCRARVLPIVGTVMCKTEMILSSLF